MSPVQPWQRPLTLPIGSTIQPVDARPLPQSSHNRGDDVSAANQRVTSSIADRQAREPRLPGPPATQVATAIEIHWNPREEILLRPPGARVSFKR